MDVALKKLDFLKVGCFAHTLNLAAQKVYDIPAVSSWCAKIRSVVVWLKRSSLSKTVLREKQRILNLPEHNVILDVKTRWNSLFLMVKRFMEQFDAIQAAALDQRLRKPMEKDKLERFTHTDLIKAEEFIKCMQVLYTSTMCVSSDKSPTCSQTIPILAKLEVRSPPPPPLWEHLSFIQVWGPVSPHHIPCQWLMPSRVGGSRCLGAQVCTGSLLVAAWWGLAPVAQSGYFVCAKTQKTLWQSDC
ncbi:uncharacterized protein LOC106456263 [Pundamilia nyererei]|uniref:Uncharacterized protein LOC106456263 n=1 Tax=Pundamilia nyererei TaxID=303518 RepID=A0A9Y6JGT5_9CICH|nr:PREDICTED: uncharacterized protein LOC106456263 [Pundamilia nyererei]